MSDLSLQLQQAASQLPVSSYFDPALFQREVQTLFQQGPRYVGHALCVPQPGDYYALPQESQGRALVRNAQGQVELISNTCRHRQAVMLQGPGQPARGWQRPCGRQHCAAPSTAGPTPERRAAGRTALRQDPCLNLNQYGLREVEWPAV